MKKIDIGKVISNVLSKFQKQKEGRWIWVGPGKDPFKDAQD